MNKLVIAIPPRGLEEVLAKYTLDNFVSDLSILANPEGMHSLKTGARLRAEYYTALLRYSTARCARAASGNYQQSSGGSGPTMPSYYLWHAMGDSFNEDLVANEWEKLQEMCPHVMGWEENQDGTETCNGCGVTVVSATKYEDEPQIVERKPPVERVGSKCANNVPAVCQARGYPCNTCNDWKALDEVSEESP